MRKLVSALLLFAVYTGMLAPLAVPVSAQIAIRAKDERMKGVPPGLSFTLGEGVQAAETRFKQPAAATDPLSEGDAANLLKRLPAIKTDPDDTTAFNKRAGTLPPPKTGNRIPVKFPNGDNQGTPQVNPGSVLDVLRYSPEGEVSLAPDLSITFSQPMVAVTSREQAAQFAPVELTPQVEGRWRWLGTKTLMFDTVKRFPMATKFTARVPAGTKAANGQMLQKDVAWTFTTPPPRVEQMYPRNQVVRRDALMYASFDQAIDPESVIKTISVTSGGRKIPVRLAAKDEVQADGAISNYASRAQPGRWLAFRAITAQGAVADALPGASTINVSVEKGTHSAEGPLTTLAAQTFQFTTFGPLKFKRVLCGWAENRNCGPFETWMLEFNNPIDGGTFTNELVQIEPAIEGQKIYPSGNYIYVEGYKKGRTTYKVTIDGALKDDFGQALGQPAAAAVRVGSAEQSLYSQGGFMAVLDPSSKSTFSIYSTNHNAVKVRMYAVRPEDWHQYQQYVRRINYDDGNKVQIPGRLVSDEVVPIKSKPDELVETRIDVSKALSGGFGNVILDVEPTFRKDKYDRTRVFTWLQSTQIGLDAFVDNSELVGFATDLRTGQPLTGVNLSVWPNGKAVSSQPSTGGDQHAASNAADEPGLLQQAWNWLTAWGGAQANRIESESADGTTAKVETIEAAKADRTGANGILRLPLPETQAEKGQNILIAKRGKDVAFLPENADYYWQDAGSWYKKTESDSLRWFVFDDRKMYRPKEEVTIKGYIRKVTAGRLGDVEPLADAATGIAWSVKDPRNNEIATGKSDLNAFGAFDLNFKLPDNVNLGYARIDFSTSTGLSGATYGHQFQIQEFRRPEFEVTARVETEAPHFVGDSAMLSVDAKYFAGGGLAGAEANWTVTATPINYTPPNRDDFTFGTWTPWWRVYEYGDYSYIGRGRSSGYGSTQVHKGVTDAAGRHLLKIDFKSVNPPRPYTVTASAAVQDINRQTWAGQTSLLVHPSSLYVGIRTSRTFVQKGENIIVESIVSDIDGNLAAGRDVDINAVLKDWTFEKGSWREVTVDEQTCAVKSADKPSICTFAARQGGQYTITATVMDERERFNESEFTVWVPGGKVPPKRNVEQEEVQVIPSKKDYAPGDVAELLVIAPFTPAEGVLTLRRDGIVKTERFSMKDSSTTLKIPLEEKYLPNIFAQVDLVGAAERSADTLVRTDAAAASERPSIAPSARDNERRFAASGDEDKSVLAPRPAFASGNINLSISTASRKLTVSAEPRDKTLVPGGETEVDVEVKDDRGEPVANSEVAVVVVDESVLALSHYSIPDPMGVFYSLRGTGTTDYHLRKDVLLGNPADARKPPPPSPVAAESGIAFSQAAPAAGRGASKLAINGRRGDNNFVIDGIAADNERTGENEAVNLRQNFDALAVFVSSAKTDSNGRVSVNVKLPDNLTRYRITAVSVDQGRRFGKTESSITAKQPLMVRPSPPRFMNFGDRIELPVVIQNQTDRDMAVDVAVRATNVLLTGAGDPGGNASVSEHGGLNVEPAQHRHNDRVGQATLPDGRVSARGQRVVVKANDRAEIKFPVAAVMAGTARFQIAANSGKFSDAAEVSLPVWTPATTEAFATYGTTDKNGAIIQPVQTPGDVYPQFGGLEVTTSSTQLQELTDAFLYLTNYPYACSEQISSRMISIAAMRDVLGAFKAKDIPTPDELDGYYKRDIQILQSRQRDDGSFGLWKKDRERYEYPFLTIHVAHALALAKDKGYKVPDEMLNKAKPYLKDIEKHFDNEWYRAAPQIRWTISAYALYVRDMMGDKDVAKAKRLLAEATMEKMPFEALGWVLSVLADDAGSTAERDAIVRFLMNRTTETASTANFVTDYGDGAWLIMYSNRRADGVLLEALIKVGRSMGRSAGRSADTPVRTDAASASEPPSIAPSARGNERRFAASGDADRSVRAPGDEDKSVLAPTNDLIPKLVRGLLDHRVKGAWSNTQENVFILLALDKYFNAFEKVTPDFVARVWLGGAYAGEQVFKGRSVDSNVLSIPMSYLTEQNGLTNLIIDREGAGQLYYRIGMRYAPKDLKLDPADYGFTVLRQYEAVDNPGDVKQNADGTWTIKSGARVRVRLTMVAQARRYHVALVDNLPAGLEILNPELAVTEVIPTDNNPNTTITTYGSRAYGHGWYRTRYWMEHQNFRDERAEAFSSLLWEGVYNYSYVTRATTPGVFVAPPAKAEEMYHPETFGRTGTDFVRVE